MRIHKGVQGNFGGDAYMFIYVHYHDCSGFNVHIKFYNVHIKIYHIVHFKYLQFIVCYILIKLPKISDIKREYENQYSHLAFNYKQCNLLGEKFGEIIKYKNSAYSLTEKNSYSRKATRHPYYIDLITQVQRHTQQCSLSNVTL